MNRQMRMDSHEPPNKLRTIPDVLKWRALVQPGDLVFSHRTYAEGEKILERTLTFGQLDQAARKIGAFLQKSGAGGERAILLYPQGLEFVKAFYGCLYAGVVAIPTYQSLSKRYFNRIETIIDDSKATFFLTTLALRDKIISLLGEDLETPMRWVATDGPECKSFSEKQYQEIEVRPDHTAYLQYTSGSTSQPKGVMVSHQNVMHNESLIYRYFEHSDSTRGVAWIPYYHDLGLVVAIMQPVYGGFPQLTMAPVDFLQQPYRWLKAITDFKATTSCAPNFAYELCATAVTPLNKKRVWT